MHPTERGKAHHGCGARCSRAGMVTKHGDGLGICTLDDRSGRLGVMLFTDPWIITGNSGKDATMVGGQVSFDDFSGGLKLTAREVMDIDEAREGYARGLAISLTDRQIDDQLLNRLRRLWNPTALGQFQYISLSEGGARARSRLARRGVSLRAIVIQRSPWPHSFGAGGTGV